MKRLMLTPIVVMAMGTPTTTSELASLTSATEWINSPPLTAEGLRGKVVLVQFWTYSCINWIRTLPYDRAWAESFGVDYPVAVDNDFAIWRAFGNQYWPALYLIDGRGRIQYRHFGEGEYEQAERVIQELLAETGARGVGRNLVSVPPRGAEAPADWDNVKSPETYLGSERSENRVSAGARLRLNQWARRGDWTVQRQAVVLNKTNGRIAYRFHARDLNLVMAPRAEGAPVPFLVLVDGRPPGPAYGIDVDEQGNGVVAEPRMYQLIRQPRPVADRQFEIRFLDPGVEVFVFTFG